MKMLLVSGHPGYWVGDDGSLWTCWRPGGGKRGAKVPLHRARTWKDRKGYVVSKLDGVQCKVHRLVLTEFVGPCPKGMECRHLNGDKSDNKLTNLAWGTAKQNWQDKIDQGGTHVGRCFGEANSAARLTDVQIEEIRRLRASGTRVVDVANMFGIHRVYASKVLNNHRRAQGTCIKKIRVSK